VVAELAGLAGDDEVCRDGTALAPALPSRGAHLLERGLEALCNCVTLLQLNLDHAMRDGGTLYGASVPMSTGISLRHTISSSAVRLRS
jgi:hypothetical protein